MEIRYCSAGLFESVGSWIHPTRTIDSNELICVIRGDVYMETDGTKYHLRPGSLLHIAADTPHGGTVPSEQVSFFWMHYTSDAPTKTWCIGTDGDGAADTAGFLRTEQMFRHLIHIANADGYPSEAVHLAAALLIIEAKRLADSGRSDESVLAGRIRAWIHTNAYRRIRVSDIAAAFGYNADYITRAYRNACGHTIKQAIDEARTDLIRTLVMQYPLGELWEKVGFEDYKSFLKYFTYHVGDHPDGV